ncbi:hypothetical protein FY534_14280 (plasmid) [Alicyclobacillus sp. TC]|uniref:hypothetical protein n=1 Tax=Alicyclobacillus sp. TC TaxID=2606450 RepID=UPI001933F604|nr:hypothetical protein [Alicyclobacillus sp. TC]QRF24937.1 hypothetical protein FY534_14280 [Alicyclobacillus sp. TC]
MKRYKKWTTAGIALTIVGLLTGCGTGGGVSSGSTPTKNITNTTSTNNTSAVAPSNNSPYGNNKTTVSNTFTSQTQTKVYVFSQPILKAMYATLRDISVGPIEPPKDIVQGTRIWASKVSLGMLNYVPEQDRALDKQLINGIRNPQESPLKYLSGYTLKSYQTPTGSGSYWWPANNLWPKWVDPIQQ